MNVTNNAVCGIIIPGMGNNLEGLIAPGESLEIPESLSSHPFVTGLIARGELVKNTLPTVEELRARCDALDIKWDGRWSLKRLQEELDAA